MLKRYTRILLGGLLTISVAACQSIGERVSIPVADTGIALAGTVVKPEGKGPFPLIVLSHGAPSGAAKRARYGYWLKPHLLDSLIKRGYAVLVPIRRGYGATGGRFVEGYGPCRDPNYYEGGLPAGQDIVAAVNYASTLSFVDKDNILLVGQSAGGFSSIAAASLNPKGVKGVVNFSGGRGGRPNRSPGVPCHPERMAYAIGKYAKTIKVPVLWHYIENDNYFSPEIAKQWFDAFEQNGGQGKLIIQPRHRLGHNVFDSKGGESVWGPAFDQFVGEMNV